MRMLLRPHLLYLSTRISYGFPPERETEGVESVRFLSRAFFVDHGMPKSRWAGIVLALLVIAAGLYPMGNWVAFGGGDRGDCSGGISALGFGFSQAVSELECRAAFGYGALLMDVILLWGLAWWLANRAFPGSKPARALEKGSEWGIVLLLLPLILVALALQVMGSGAARLFARRDAKKADRTAPPGS